MDCFRIFITKFLVVMVIKTVISDNQLHIAILDEEIVDLNQKRELTLLPDTLRAKFTTNDDVIVLNLERMRNINSDMVDITVEGESFDNNNPQEKRHVGYYQDLENFAPIMVEAKVEYPKVKRVMTGTLIHKNRMYELHPASEQLQSLDNILEEKGLKEEHAHMIHTIKEVDKNMLFPDKAPQKRNNEKRSKEDNLKDLLRLLKGFNNVKEAEIKRQASSGIKEFHVEMMFVADYSVYKFFHYDKKKSASEAMSMIKYQYLHIFNGMYMSFRSFETTDFAVVLWLSDLTVITDPDKEIAKCGSASKCGYNGAFKRASEYERKEKLKRKLPDHISYFTKRDLWALEDPNDQADVLGVCPFGGVCEPYSNHCFNEDSGVISWHTAAHELAHNLGADHDDAPEYNNKCTGTYIMAASDYVITQSILNTAFKFSPCSIAAMKKLITGESDQVPRKCLHNTICKHNQPLKGIDSLPGHRYSLNEQCILFMGHLGSKKSEKCKDDDICKYVTCYDPTSKECSFDSSFRAAPGTPCDTADKNKVCYNGRCVDKGTIKTAANDARLKLCGSNNKKPTTTTTTTTTTTASPTTTTTTATTATTTTSTTTTTTTQASNGGQSGNEAPCPDLENISTHNPSCPGGQVECFCQPTRKCIDASQILDGQVDCESDSDEEHDYLDYYCALPPRVCPGNQVNCPNCGIFCIDPGANPDDECPDLYGYYYPYNDDDKKSLPVEVKETENKLKTNLLRLLKNLKQKKSADDGWK